jgi:hypothetical protein
MEWRRVFQGTVRSLLFRLSQLRSAKKRKRKREAAK